MIRLAHVINDLGYGGAQSVLAQLIGGTRDRFEHHVVSLGELRDGAERFERVAASVASTGMTRWRAPLALPRLIRRLADIRPALAVTWLYHGDLLGGLAAHWLDAPVCWNVRHGSIEARTTRWTTRGVACACAALSRRLPRAIVFNSERSRVSHAALGYDASRATVIPNGIDVDRFRPDPEAGRALRAELNVPPHALLVGIAGRFCPDKDFETFAAAAAEVARTKSDVWFVACGAGVDANNRQLLSWLAERKITSRTRLLGVRRDMPRVLAAFDALVCSSRTEAFPNVVAEALACGVPCASTDVGDVRELIGPAGRVVPIGAAAALAAGCLDCLEARGALAAMARRQIVERYSQAAMIERHVRLWEQLAGVSRGERGRAGDYGRSPRRAILASRD